jgi:predicted O-methyltransferase YrrM
MSWLSNLFRRRRAQSEAREYLAASGLDARLTREQRRDLLRLRRGFAREKMGQWPERVTLYVAASRLPPRACIVEIGSWVGVGTCYLAAGLQAGNGGRVFAVDTYRGTTLDPGSAPAWAGSVARLGGSTLPRLRENLEAFGLAGLVEPIVSESPAAAVGWTGGGIDLLFIDGDHVYEAVKADFEAWHRHVKADGLILFHDYDERHPGVKRLVGEVLAGPLRGVRSERVGSLLSVQLGSSGAPATSGA